jgi:dihydroorotase
VVEAEGCIVVPGLIDIHVHLREPGGEEAETVDSGSQAAARGGFTTVVAMPNTTPPIDTAERTRWLVETGYQAGHARVLPASCITVGREGRAVADLEAMAEAGAVAFTDDGCTVQDDVVMEAAMRLARELDRPIMDHAQDRTIERQGGVMHEGAYSKQFGLPGIPTLAESRIIARDIRLAEATGCRVHIQHVTSREGVDLIRAAREKDLPVSGEASPHHLALADADIDPADADFKMNPPLRSEDDREALREAVVDGTLQLFATDHAPHPAQRKAEGFLTAPFGVVGLETAVGVTYTELVRTGLIDLPSWVRRWTVEPARVLGLAEPALPLNRPADLAVLDLQTSWVVEPEVFRSRSRNTPFKGRTLTGRARLTCCNGEATWQADTPGLR